MKKVNSEAGNRTPVVRVTGGNTKPLYYFGSVLDFKLQYFKIVFLDSFSRKSGLFNIMSYYPINENTSIDDIEHLIVNEAGVDYESVSCNTK